MLLFCMQTVSYAQTKIACVGNSITEGYGLDWNAGQRPWPEQMANMLGNSYKVINCGRSGTTMLKSATWAEGGSRSYWGSNDHGYGQAKRENPDIVIIALGTNDASVKYNVNEFKTDYIDMINEFKAINGNVKLYLCLPPTIYNGWNNNLIKDLIPAIRQIAYFTGATVIDLNSVTANHRNDLYNDDLHPNVNGAKLLAQTIYNVITKVGPSIIPYGEDTFGWRQLTELTVTAGEPFALGPQPNVENGWSWTGPNGFTSNKREIQFASATTQQSGEYVATYNGQKATIKVNVLNTAGPKIYPYLSGDGGKTWPQTTTLVVNQGANVAVGPQASVEGGNPDPIVEGSWHWTGPDNFRYYDRDFTLNNIQFAKGGTYTATFIDKNGRRAVEYFNIIVSDPNAPVPNITPYTSTDGGNTWPQTTKVTVTLGSTFSLGPQADQNGSWSWTGPDGFKSNDREITIANVTEAKLGNYVLTFTSDRGKQAVVTFTVSTNGGGANVNPAIPAEAKVAYRLVNGNKSLFVTNASLANNAEVVDWDETDVSAQQWFKLDNGNNTCRFQNVYTGKYLTNNGGLKQTGNRDENGTVFNVQGNSVNINGRNYNLQEVPAQYEFNAELRDHVMAGFLAQYLQDKGGTFTTICNGGWGESESLEVILDAYETSGNKQYLNIFEQSYAYFKDKVGDVWNQGLLPGKSGYGWYGYDYNDDVMWHIILAGRAFKMTGNRVYLEDAKRNFDLIWNRSYLGYVGLLRWAEAEGRDRNETNSCVNGPAEVAACYIAEGYADLGDNNTANTYWDRAKTLYSNQRIYLSDMNTGEVYDNVKFNGETTNVRSQNKWSSSYNQGTMLGAATLLHKHFGDNMYKNDAQKIYKYTADNMTDEYRIVKMCEGMANGDLQGFKGILMRYIRNYYEHFGDEDARDVLLRNAFHVYNNRNTRGFGLTNWRRKAPEDFQYDGKDYRNSPFAAVTMVSAAFNAPLYLPAGESKEIEVENMTLAGYAAKHDDGRTSNGAYVSGIGGNDNQSGTASFTYNAPAAGKYVLDIFYMSGMKRDIKVTAGGKTVTVSCFNNGSWDGTAINATRVVIDLNAGQNTIVLGNNAAAAPNLDKVVISPAGVGNTVLPERAGGVLEAENAELNGNVHIEYAATASRHIGVGNIGNALNSLTFHYYAPRAGEYEIDVHYSSADDRNMFSQVNGGEQKYETYPKSGNAYDYKSIGTKTIKVQLQAGENTIKFGNATAGQYAPDLDYIVLRDVTPEPEPEPEPIVTVIEQVREQHYGDGRIYNLNGQAVKDVKKGGVYVRNGKKFIVK